MYLRACSAVQANSRKAPAAPHAAERAPSCALLLFKVALAVPPMAEGLHGDAGRPP
eukprot:CAMPEP_0172583804 /NCGR_PEP_ID=MMETSP1068-20121228/3348_1 /TAXON_ID=35684 /ORGANISM="Pseudopedinella elastica, Strain CCMP716" /LENGTH=55 /DNA_ID=CAMNT_0013377723 /DNA_START=131 /DNA_END=295 /DNA_ORIENTATION=+